MHMTHSKLTGNQSKNVTQFLNALIVCFIMFLYWNSWMGYSPACLASKTPDDQHRT